MPARRGTSDDLVAARVILRQADLAPHDLDDPGLVFIFDDAQHDTALHMSFDRLHGVWFVHLFSGPVRRWPSLSAEGSRELVARGHGDTPLLWQDRKSPAVTRQLRQRGVPITTISFKDVVDGAGTPIRFNSITANDMLRGLGL